MMLSLEHPADSIAAAANSKSTRFITQILYAEVKQDFGHKRKVSANAPFFSVKP
jgi:hypothetical protein